MIVFIKEIVDNYILRCYFLDKTDILDSIIKIFLNTSSAIVSNSDFKKCCGILNEQVELPDFL